MDLKLGYGPNSFIVSLAYVYVKALLWVLYVYEVCSWDGNIARGEAECYITIEAKRWVLYFLYSMNKAML